MTMAATSESEFFTSEEVECVSASDEFSASDSISDLRKSARDLSLRFYINQVPPGVPLLVSKPNYSISAVLPRYRVESPTDSSSSDTRDNTNNNNNFPNNAYLEQLGSPRGLHSSPEKLRSPRKESVWRSSSPKVLIASPRAQSKQEAPPTTGPSMTTPMVPPSTNSVVGGMSNSGNSIGIPNSVGMGPSGNFPSENNIPEKKNLIRQSNNVSPSKQPGGGTSPTPTPRESRLENVTCAWTEFRSVLISEFGSVENELRQKTRGLRAENEKLKLLLQSKNWALEILEGDNLKLTEQINASNQAISRLRSENKSLQDMLATEMKNASTKYMK